MPMSKMKVGEIARKVLRPVLECTKFSANELKELQNPTDCKDIFNLNYPLLAKERDPFRYYSDPVTINENDSEIYYVCNDWYDVPSRSNYNRDKLVDWIYKRMK